MDDVANGSASGYFIVNVDNDGLLMIYCTHFCYERSGCYRARSISIVYRRKYLSICGFLKD